MGREFRGQSVCRPEFAGVAAGPGLQRGALLVQVLLSVVANRSNVGVSSLWLLNIAGVAMEAITSFAFLNVFDCSTANLVRV